MDVAPLLVLLLQAAPTSAEIEAIRASIEKTSAAGYAYEVRGKYVRSGEFTPQGLLASRIRQYQSARLGDAILVKGPEGLWKTPEERLGEKVENPDPEAPDMVRILQDAAAPHLMVRDLLDLAPKAFGPEDREVDGIMCRRTVLPFPLAVLKDTLARRLERAAESGLLAPPDEVRWSSARGSLRVYADKRTGRLVKVIDERSVKIAYRVPDGSPQVKTYKVDMEFEFRPLDPERISIPREVRERLKIKD